MAESCTFEQWYREVCRDVRTMDRPKSIFNPRNLIICVATCTIAALWAVIFAALYFYFWGPSEHTVVHNVTEVAVPLYQPHRLPWYLNGTLQPSPSPVTSLVPLWYHQLPSDPLQRLQNQLMFLPQKSGENKIVLFLTDSPSEVDEYQMTECPVHSCVFTASFTSPEEASAIVFRSPQKLKSFNFFDRLRSQVWIFNVLSPPGVNEFIHPRDLFNWTATPRLDSDVPIFSHGIWMYYDTRWKHQQPPITVAQHKTLAAAAWFPSSCDEQSRAYRYVARLSHFTLVDGFGSAPCGDSCPQNQTDICLKLLREKYRVALILDERFCNHSVPDMFYVALEANTVPVVMWPERSVYEQLVPEGSFIHTDDFASPRDLAWHLETIYEDDAVFHEYQSWQGTGKFVKSWHCRLCALLHHNNPPTLTIPDINEWWNPEGECLS